MESIVTSAIKNTFEASTAYCKFIVPNEVGKTGSHQAGFYVAKPAFSILFDIPGERGSNKDKFVEITWQDDFVTESRFIYYGKKTRNEYRITRFGKDFPFLRDGNIGDLFVLLKVNEDYYKAYVLSSEVEIETYLSTFGLSPVNTNTIIDVSGEYGGENAVLKCYQDFISDLKVDFPPTKIVANQSRLCYNSAFDVKDVDVVKSPDNMLVRWVGSEYELFKALERSSYSKYLNEKFSSIEDLVSVANTILNRRKSRAGASLEHHLEEVFVANELKFTSQPVTEGRKKPDFLFPGVEEYKNLEFDAGKLTVLAVKTTCKDRWRQILNEADRIPIKHLFTLQQGISSSQLKEMAKENVQLVVPEQYLKTFPKEHRNSILNLKSFIDGVR